MARLDFGALRFQAFPKVPFGGGGGRISVIGVVRAPVAIIHFALFGAGAPCSNPIL